MEIKPKPTSKKQPKISVYCPKKAYPQSCTSKVRQELNRLYERTQDGVEILNPAEPKKQ